MAFIVLLREVSERFRGVGQGERIECEGIWDGVGGRAVSQGIGTEGDRKRGAER